VAPGKASWTVALANFHEHTPPAVCKSKILDSKSEIRIQVNEISIQTNKAFTQEWASLSIRPLTRHGSTTCIVISRTTLITLLII